MTEYGDGVLGTGNETSDSVKDGKFLVHLCHCHLLKDSGTWSMYNRIFLVINYFGSR
jgi:hypothetical protein